MGARGGGMLEKRGRRLVCAPRELRIGGKGWLDKDAFYTFNTKPLGVQRTESSLGYPGRMVG